MRVSLYTFGEIPAQKTAFANNRYPAPSPLLSHILLYIHYTHALYHPGAGLPIYTYTFFFSLLKYYIPTGHLIIYYIITDMEYFKKKIKNKIKFDSIQTNKHPAKTTFFLVYTMRIRYFRIFFYVHVFTQLPRIFQRTYKYPILLQCEKKYYQSFDFVNHIW